MHSTSLPVSLHSSSAWIEARDAAMVAIARLVELLPTPLEKFAERESAVLEVLNHVGARILAADLQRAANSYPDEIFVRGDAYRRHELGTVEYHTLCGSIEISRDTFRRIGLHNGPTIVPVELEAGIIDSATPALAYCIALGVAEVPSREYDALMRAAHRKPPSRSTVDREAKFIGGAVKEESLNLEVCLRVEETVPDDAHAIAIGMDRTTVPMAEVREADEPPATRRKRRSKPYVRKRPPRIDVMYRMAYVGTVSIVDRDGVALVTRRYAASAAEGANDLVFRMMRDVQSIREQRELPVAIVQDGASELWGLLWDGLRSIGVAKWQNVLDRYHLVEHLNAVIRSVVKGPKAQAAQIEHWGAQLERDDRAVHRFARWMIDKCGWERLNRNNVLGSHYSYIESWSSVGATRYVKFRRAGFPQASGVTEGACKSLITARFKRSGQRWHEDGFTALVTLRAMKQSERFDRMWCRFASRFSSEIQWRN